MKIKLAAILEKKHEWQPQNNIFYNSIVMFNIFLNEKINFRLECIQNIKFDALTQRFNNVVVSCAEKTIKDSKTGPGNKFTLRDIETFQIGTEILQENSDWQYVKIDLDQWKGRDEIIINNETLYQYTEKNPEVNFTVNIYTIIPGYIDQFIYFVQVGEKKYWTYVVNKNFDLGQNVILTLQIDVVTSNLNRFNSRKFEGEVYVERTNNIEKKFNTFHSDICAGITNQKFNNLKTNKQIDRTIDNYIQSQGPRNTHRWINGGRDLRKSTTVTEYGTAYLDNNQNFIAHSTWQFLSNKKIRNIPILPLDIQTMLTLAGSKNSYYDPEWNFSTFTAAENFIRNVTTYGINETQINDILDVASSSEVINWISIPRFFTFEQPTNSFTNYGKLTIDELPNIDLKDHLLLHRRYYLVIGKIFRIPIDLLKIENKTIYINRVLGTNSVKFIFYYEIECLNEFYNVDIAIGNGLYNDNWTKFQRDLDLQYNNGLKGFNPLDLVQAILGTGVGTLFTGGFGALISAFGAQNLINIPFKLFREKKQEHYQNQRILDQPMQSRNTLLSEVLNQITFGLYKQVEFGKIEVKNVSGQNDISYFVKNNINVQSNNSLSIYLIEERPIFFEEEIIKYDQQNYGNIINNTQNIDNPLKFNDLTPEFLYWQGKINPTHNPIDNFELDLLNQKLAMGVKIWKELRPFPES